MCIRDSYGTTYTIKEMGIRHFILRQNPKPGELVDWINQLNRVAEETILLLVCELQAFPNAPVGTWFFEVVLAKVG